MSVVIPLSILYAAPALPLFILGWASQIRADRCVRAMTNEETTITADTELAEFLRKADLNDVEIVRSENYSQNEYVEEENKIYLSPDTLGHKDVASVALALRSGAQALAYRRASNKTQLAKTLHFSENILFWLTFSVLAFGIMASSAPTTIAGYAFGIGVWIVWRWRQTILRDVDRLAVDFAEARPTFNPEITVKIKKVLESERKKF